MGAGGKNPCYAGGNVVVEGCGGEGSVCDICDEVCGIKRMEDVVMRKLEDGRGVSGV